MSAPTTGKIPVPFPSEAWAKKYVEILNGSKDYEESAKNWEGSMLFVIQPDGGATPFEIGVWLDLWHGKCRGYKFWVDGQEKPQSDYIFAGIEKNWLAMLAGKLDPIQGLMAGKFALKSGKMQMVMRHTLAAKHLVTHLQAFEMDIVAADNKDPAAKVVKFLDKDKNVVVVVDREKNTFTVQK
ncbi:MAG: SCP2 sterol-binding domain-containing protein [Candidatus Lokiarchaeota archaeon]|nr:SCP2 sterol-binding domain-containing protein [Candidatus Lokiarchaeota archaeon]